MMVVSIGSWSLFSPSHEHLLESQAVRPHFLRNQESGRSRFTCTVLQCTHYIIMLQSRVLFMAPLQDLSPNECPSPIFILCDTCLWCATYFDDTRLSRNGCPQCGANKNERFPIISNESFTCNHSDKLGMELKFMHR
jgi:hypothetical protein